MSECLTILTRKQAKTAGLKRHFTGKPCKRGHIAERNVGSNACLKCLKENGRHRLESRKKDDKKYREKNREARNSSARERAKQLGWSAVLSKTKKRRLSSLSEMRVERIFFLIVYQKGRCANCGIYLRGYFHLDHIIPLAKGGTNNRRNLQLLCQQCNLSKGAKHPVEFAIENGRLI